MSDEVTYDNPVNRALNVTSPGKWSQKGGTKTKTDAEALSDSNRVNEISIKNHEGKSGTFDWLNTTKDVPEEVCRRIKEFQTANMGSDVTARHRTDINEILSSGLDSMSSDGIRALLVSIHERYPEHILINDKANKTLILCNKSSLLSYIPPDVTYLLKYTRGKTSRQVFIVNPDGTEVKTGLRLRLVLNNGVGALLGKSEKNKCSVPCIKLQQDNVKGFIESCAGKVTCPYSVVPVVPLVLEEPLISLVPPPLVLEEPLISLVPPPLVLEEPLVLKEEQKAPGI